MQKGGEVCKFVLVYFAKNMENMRKFDDVYSLKRSANLSKVITAACKRKPNRISNQVGAKQGSGCLYGSDKDVKKNGVFE